MERRIKIVSSSGGEFSTELEVSGTKYIVITEDEKPFVVTRIYRGGEIVSVRKGDYSEFLGSQGLKERVRQLMAFQHKNVLDVFMAERKKEQKSPADYISLARTYLKKKKEKEAFDILSSALLEYPQDPFIMSYYGCLDAIVNKNCSEAVATCKAAISNLKKTMPFGEEFFYPVFYLNLARAYLACGKKKEAIGALKKGLEADRENPDIIWELRRLGLRRKPPLPFLKRSNPINKYIGMLLSKIK